LVRLEYHGRERCSSEGSARKLKDYVRSAGAALGVTTIYLLWLLGPLIRSTHTSIYHWDGSPSQLFVAPILNFCFFWLLLALVLILARGRLRIAVWCGIIGLAPWVQVKNWYFQTHTSIPHWLSVLVLGLGLSVFPVLVVLWRSEFERKFEQVEDLAATLFLFAGFYGLAILSQYGWLSWQARSLNERPVLAAMQDHRAQAGRPRVIWLLFDELSYMQVYERRFPGLQLPAFDALAAQSTVFTHAIPAGIRTEIVLPSLLTGEPVDRIQPSADGRQLSLHNPHTGAWQGFDEHDTVFEDAIDLNYRTAVAGWYNPYCRILPHVVDHCFWTYAFSAENGMVPGAPLQTNMMRPWMRFFGMGAHIASLFPESAKLGDDDQHLSDYLALANAADRMLEDKTAGFVLIHMPIPHPHGIYDRKRQQFSITHSDYLDNLALADLFLKHVRSKLEQSGQWDSSTIVVMADHSWRTKLMWEETPGWTNEEDVASQGGQFDERPAYVVKLPEQHMGERIDAPFSAVNTRKLLDAFLAQKIRSKEELSAWALQSGR
jgi:Sulfatase